MLHTHLELVIFFSLFVARQSCGSKIFCILYVLLWKKHLTSQLPVGVFCYTHNKQVYNCYSIQEAQELTFLVNYESSHSVSIIEDL